MSRTFDAGAPAGRSTSALRLLASPWIRVLAVYGASRLYSSALLAAMLAVARSQDWTLLGVRGAPTFATFHGSWDGWFYRTIAERGYPMSPPMDSFGHLLPNPWAFLPLFPALERVLTASTGMSTFAAGAVVATIAGAGAAVLLERLLRPRIGEQRALTAVALFAFGPLGFLLQVAYAEALFLLLLFAALIAMQRGAYLTLIPLVVLAAFTRPGAIAVPAALAVQLALEWCRARRPPPHVIRAGLALTVGTAACLAWPVIADLVTGLHGTYVATELSWWTGWVGRPEFVPFTPWFLITSRWLGPVGVALAVVLAGAVLFWILRHSPRELGSPVGGFSVMYLLYLVAVFLPQFSLPRLLLPLVPLLGSSTFTGTPARRRGWLIAAAALQPAGVLLLWFLSYP